MSVNVENEAELERIESAAAEWLLRQDGDAWSAAHERALEQWLQASPHHKVAYIRLRSVWRLTPELRQLSPERRFVLHHASKRSRGRRYAAAAAIMLTLGLAMLGVHWLATRSTFETPIGGLETVPTEDGSRITLNTNTRIEVRMDEQARRVELDRGEAFFEVAKDGRRPFIVEAGTHRVIAVGTKFSVRIVSDEVHVAVTEGKVRVEPRAAVEHSMVPDALPSLSAGWTATVHREGADVQQQPIPTIEQMLSWRRGFIVLDDASLAEAAAQFNRYNTRQLIVADPAIEAIRVGGNFHSNNVEGFVRLLEQGFGIVAEEQEHTVLLRGGHP